ncbi:MAG: anthranilate synthase component I family protein [Deltaproteobacteria bacterium]|nr:anthranilate synthase component I family protein [Deltaproteobacteria bacterium]
MSVRLFQNATSLESDLDTPVGLFLRLVGEGKGILFESAEVDGRWGRYSIIATEFVLALSCRDGKLAVSSADAALDGLARHAGKPFPDGLRECLADIELSPAPGVELPPITRAVYGYLGYGLAGLFEPKLAGVLPPEEAEATLVLPGTLVIFDHGYNKITRLELFRADPDRARVRALAGTSVISRSARPASKLAGKEEYTAAVARVTERLHQGEGIQVVLSTPFDAPLAESPFGVYRRLRHINPSPYMFYMRFDDGVLLGSSPEVMVTCDEGRLRLCPIAGTRPRSADMARDALFGDELLEDPKEKAEHVMLVDLGRNDLGRIAKPGSVTLERFMEVERFSHVMHLTSRIGADLADGKDGVDVLAATFPAGTVSGAPKVRAMEIIAEEEGSPRGPYAGAIGWMSLDRGACSLDFGITIRSLWIREGRIHWQAGAGIVHDSVPEKEWDECLAKAEVIRKVVSLNSPVNEEVSHVSAC